MIRVTFSTPGVEAERILFEGCAEVNLPKEPEPGVEAFDLIQILLYSEVIPVQARIDAIVDLQTTFLEFFDISGLEFVHMTLECDSMSSMTVDNIPRQLTSFPINNPYSLVFG